MKLPIEQWWWERGNAAIDAARTLLRLGAEVNVVYRRTKSEMPAIPEEIEEAEKEGVIFHFLMTPLEVIGEDGKVKGIRLQRMKLGDFDRSGRRRPVPIEGAEALWECDMVVEAVGQIPEVGRLGEILSVDHRGNIIVDPYSLSTSLPGVFAGGDAIGKEATVSDAMALGKRAAFNIHQYLRDLKPEEEEVVIQPERPRILEEPPVLQEIPRVKPPELPVRERVRSFSEVKLCLEEDDARREAERCLRCDLDKVIKKYQEIAMAEEEAQ